MSCDTKVTAPRLLIVKTSSMGDVIHALPTLSDIRRERPEWRIDWMVERPFDAVVRMRPEVDRVLVLAWRRWRKALAKRETWTQIGAFRHELRDRPYDLVLDLQGLIKSALWGVQARGPMVGYDRRSAREPLACLAYAREVAVAHELHAVERCRRLAAEHLGYELPTSAPDFGLVPPQAPTWRARSPRFAVLVPMASADAKLWPQEDWIAVSNHLRAYGLPCVVLWGSTREEMRARAIAEGAAGEVPPFLSIGDAAALLRGASLVVGLDTGFTHLAAALGVDTVCLLGAAHDASEVGVTGAGHNFTLGSIGRKPRRDEVFEAVDAIVARQAASPGERA